MRYSNNICNDFDVINDINRHTLPATTKRQTTSHRTHTAKNHNFTLTLPPPSLQNENNQCDNQHHSRELLMMGIVVPETF